MNSVRWMSINVSNISFWRLPCQDSCRPAQVYMSRSIRNPSILRRAGSCWMTGTIHTVQATHKLQPSQTNLPRTFAHSGNLSLFWCIGGEREQRFWGSCNWAETQPQSWICWSRTCWLRQFGIGGPGGGPRAEVATFLESEQWQPPNWPWLSIFSTPTSRQPLPTSDPLHRSSPTQRPPKDIPLASNTPRPPYQSWSCPKS